MTKRESDQYHQRLSKLERIVEQGLVPYPARVKRTHTANQVLELLAKWKREHSSGEGPDDTVAICGRILSMRIMGRASFAHIADGTGRIQIYVSQDDDSLGQEGYQLFKQDLDIGDFIAVGGKPFYTKAGEPTVRASRLEIIAKTLRPLPEKWHGLKDVEARYRQRYLDLIANEEVRRVAITRSRMVSTIRRFMDQRGFLEVETPILQPIYGGAIARPFETHHHALKRKLYLRIADELYLKRLIIGGLEKVYEIGKDFRNEGLSAQHNPEFTMIEAYQAYADYHDMMDLAEGAFAYTAREVLGSTKITYQGQEIELAPPWRRATIGQAFLEETGIDIVRESTLESLKKAIEKKRLEVTPQDTWGKLVEEVFKEYVEPKLTQPTFILDYPLEISPLAKEKRDAPGFVERFEFFIAGLECGNAFSELNDPLEQRERFRMSQGLKSDEEDAHPLDEDFILALEYGMPPTGGIGWGIDRMVMLFTDQPSIREVILFPQLRSKQE